MIRIIRLLAGIVLIAAIGAQTVSFAAPISTLSSGPLDTVTTMPIDIGSPLQVAIHLNATEAQANRIQIQLQIDAVIPVQDIQIVWESPQTITPVTTDAIQPLQLVDSQHAELVYILTLGTKESQILTVSAIGHTLDGMSVGSRISKLLSVSGGQYILAEVPEPPIDIKLIAEQVSPTSTSRDSTRAERRPHATEEKDPVLAQAEVTVYVTGCWAYYEARNDWSYARVEIWDDNGNNPDTRLSLTHAGRDGCFDDEVISSEADGPDIYVRAFTRDDYAVRVVSSITDINDISTTYYAETNVFYNVTGGTFDVGFWIVNSTDVESPAVYIYDLIADRAWHYLDDKVGWKNNFNLPVRWTPDSTDGTWYFTGDGIHLKGSDRWDPDVILHEYGHFVMHKTYQSDIMTTPCLQNHDWNLHSSNRCAWVEGWAWFLQGAIQNDRYFSNREEVVDTFHDLELPDLSTSGADVEGAVAASLWDIFDSPINNLPESWDNLVSDIDGTNNNGIWKIFFEKDPNDVYQFLTRWANSNNGYNTEVKTIFSHHGIGVPGDANLDGKVDGLDYVIWLNNYNTQTPNGPSDGDFNIDGKVDGLDYVVWLNNYNKW